MSLPHEPAHSLGAGDRRFRTLIEGIEGCAVFLLDPHGLLMSWNPGAERITGYTAEEAFGRPLDEILRSGANQPGRMVAVMDAAGRSEDEGWRIRKDGARYWAHTMVEALDDEAGHLFGFATVLSDLTQRRLADETLVSVLENVLEGIITIDDRGVIESFNPAAARIFGYPAEEVLGRNVNVLMPEPFRSDHDSHISAYLQTGHRKIIGIGREVVGRRGDGSTFPMDLSVTEFRLGDRRFFTGIIRDITERKRMEQELHRRLADLAEVDRRKDEFLAMLAHELRNPLAALGGAYELLKVHAGHEQAAWGMEVIGRQLSHLSRLVDDLLDVSRITLGKIHLRKEVVDVARVMRSSIAAVKPLMDARKHYLRVSARPGELWLEVDPTRLEQVFSNLLSNAAKYTGEGGVIDFSAERDGGEIVVRFRDTGIGIASEELPHVFELFAQGDHTLARSQGGLGIGLTLVRTLTEMHGGTVTAASEGRGKGSEFTVRLTAAERPGADAGPLSTAGHGSAHGRVLIVDDNVDLARGLAQFMKHLGYEVEAVHDGPSALDAAGEFRPGLVLLDIGLPGIDGYEVARQLRSQEHGREARIIALTGYGQDEDVKRSREAGFDMHLVKPVTFQQLARVLADHAA
ncbi:MAG: PAS domain S-box protein [Isosphaeraceae bacterium]